MNLKIEESLSFDDVLLKPKYSEVSSRSNVDTSVKINNFIFSHPVIPANMKTVSGKDMAKLICKSGGLAILHRFMPIEEQLSTVSEMYKKYTDSNKHVAVSVGVKKEDFDNISKFIEVGVKIFCIDIAHGDSKLCVEMIKHIKNFDTVNSITVIAGNVATGEAAFRLWQAGADVVKVGVGPGSLCTTRVETGNGVAQLSALAEVHQSRRYYTNQYPNEKKYIIADGGIKAAGDCVKALCFSDMVMIGNMFSGTDETPGEVLRVNGVACKEYVGSSTHKTTHIEGVAALVPTKGSAKDVLDKLLQGIKSGCSYQGCSSIDELQVAPIFVKITSAGLKESNPHNPFTIGNK